MQVFQEMSGRAGADAPAPRRGRRRAAAVRWAVTGLAAVIGIAWAIMALAHEEPANLRPAWALVVAASLATVWMAVLAPARRMGRASPVRQIAVLVIVGAMLAGMAAVSAVVDPCRKRGTGVDLTACTFAGEDLHGAMLENADLTDVDLSRVNLAGANLRGARLTGARLADADLSGALLSDAGAQRAVLTNTRLAGAVLESVDLAGADLAGADLSGSRMQNSLLSGTSLVGAHLADVDLRSAQAGAANLADADLTGADLSGADLTNAVLVGARLAGANLRGAKLNGVKVDKPDLSGAQLQGAQFVGINLSGAILTKAQGSSAAFTNSNLAGADLSGAELSGATFTGAELAGASFAGARLGSANLTGARALGASFERADLRGATLNNADLTRAQLTQAQLAKAQAAGTSFFEATLVSVDLQEAKLSGANLSGARIIDANLAKADLKGAAMGNVELRNLTMDGAVLTDTSNLNASALASAFLVDEGRLSRAVLDRSIRFETPEQIRSRVGPACAGNGVAGAPTYTGAPVFHALVVLNGDGKSTPNLPALSTAVRDAKWEPAGVRFTDLVACVENETTTTFQICPYTVIGSGAAASSISRLQVHRRVRLVAAATGVVVGERTFSGGTPAVCPQTASLSQTEVRGTAPAVDDIKAWLAGFVRA